MKQKDFDKGLQGLIEKGLVEKTSADEYKLTGNGKKIIQLVRQIDTYVTAYLDNILSGVKNDRLTSYNTESGLKDLCGSMPDIPHSAKHLLETILKQNANGSLANGDDVFKAVIAKLLYEQCAKGNVQVIKSLRQVYREVCFNAENPGYT